jgi:hypothetical protein
MNIQEFLSDFFDRVIPAIAGPNPSPVADKDRRIRFVLSYLNEAYDTCQKTRTLQSHLALNLNGDGTVRRYAPPRPLVMNCMWRRSQRPLFRVVSKLSQVDSGKLHTSVERKPISNLSLEISAS